MMMFEFSNEEVLMDFSDNSFSDANVGGNHAKVADGHRKLLFGTVHLLLSRV